ncbi:Serine/threonine-protein kinase VPS15 [Smittium mucronatum]|uniref:Serine/threonine-protein kinase VPS15 n=1 Tax=Smittium mucronatum TaxID=133383 RepID=A0A1R0H9J8_9FUNG|nr:Serine/threonine-protein kinase VPS15 [Smittium mucronatum]
MVGLAESAERFSNSSFPNKPLKISSNPKIYGSKKKPSIKSDEILLYTGEFFIESSRTLLSGNSDEAKRAYLLGIERLLSLFRRVSNPGQSKMAVEVIMAHLLTFLNIKTTWQLRVQFFEAIFYIGVAAGRYTVENYILPMILSAIEDTEEFVLGSCLSLFEKLGCMGLLGYHELVTISKKISPLIIHPNQIISSLARRFFIFIENNPSLDNVQKYYISVFVLKDYLTHPQFFDTKSLIDVEFLPKTSKDLFYYKAFKIGSLSVSSFDDSFRKIVHSSDYSQIRNYINDTNVEFRIKVLNPFIQSASRNLINIKSDGLESRFVNILRPSDNTSNSSANHLMSLPKKVLFTNILELFNTSLFHSKSGFNLEEIRKPESHKGKSYYNIDRNDMRGITISPLIGVSTSLAEAVFSSSNHLSNNSQIQPSLNNQISESSMSHEVINQQPGNLSSFVARKDTEFDNDIDLGTFSSGTIG